LNGFRPGKAPLTVIRQQFGPQVHREVIGELLQSSFSEAVTQKQLAPAGKPAHRAAEHRRGPGPEIRRDLRGVSGSRAAAHRFAGIERVTADVTESDIDAMIERLRKQQMKYAPRGACRGAATR
jgi:trigger factor